MKAVGVIVLAVVAFTSFTGTSCSPLNTEIEDDCHGFTDTCTREYKPVCGSDAVTYSNKCMFCDARKGKGKANLLVQFEGECKPKDDCYGFPEVCTKEYKPVCGSDAVTYSNKCMFCNAKKGKGKANLLVLFEGQCKQKDNQDDCERYGDMCTMEYRPVCGSDGATYGNKCDFCRTKRQKKANLLIVSEGECKPKDDCYGFTEVCTREHNPVCGSDGVTYSNKCMFCNARKGKGKVNLLVLFEGECKPKDDCHEFTVGCTREYKPVCGSDAVTYSNKCMFCDAKKGKANLLVLFEGECKPKDNQDDCERYGDMCTMEYRPVCGSDGATYGNKCDFCRTKRQTKGNLLIVSEGECKPKDDCHDFTVGCTREYNPVCGSDAVTYSNKCMFCDAKKRKGKANLLVLFEGECKPKDNQDDCERYGDMCTLEYRPVCGSDGATYGNKCDFCRTKRQTKGNLLIVSEGECKPKDDCYGFTEACTREYKPVCGSDAVTYSNKCMFCDAKKGKGKANLLILFEGECKPKGNQPQDDCQGYGDMCTYDYRPVCGSDGVTYSNKCDFCQTKKKHAKTDLLIISEGECKPKDECEGSKGDVCPAIYSPVCGSDGVTYSNKCKFCATRKQQGKTDVRIVSEGACKPKDECEASGDVCPFIYSPVCGSDGVTYSNECIFCANKKKQAKTDLLIVSKGKCKPKDGCEGSNGAVCPAIYRPVCGSDGVTYSSKCMFCATKKRQGKTDVLIVSEGKCKPKDECEGSKGNMCTKIYRPVCGSDGVTYSNKCRFCATKTQKTELTLVSEEACPKQSY